MERKRSYLEIARDILKAAQYGAKPTAVVYKANLNFNIIKKYLKEMQEAGLIRVDAVNGLGSTTRLYSTTEKGRVFIEALDRTLEIYYSSVQMRGGAPPEIAQEVS